MLDTMSQHVGTTSGHCSTGQIAAFWNEFYVEDSVKFYYFYLAVWWYDLLDNYEDQIKFKCNLNLNLN